MARTCCKYHGACKNHAEKSAEALAKVEAEKGGHRRVDGLRLVLDVLFLLHDHSGAACPVSDPLSQRTKRNEP
eukprot:1634570-Rhodomonas_salina.3